MIAVLGAGWREVEGGLKPVPALYVLTKRGRPVYVGQTSNVKMRLAQHSCTRRKSGGLIKSCWDKAFFLPHNGSKSERLGAEGSLILRFRPRFNSPSEMCLSPKQLKARMKVWKSIKAKADCFIRLKPDVGRLVRIEAKKNGISVPSQVNFTLRRELSKRHFK